MKLTVFQSEKGDCLLVTSRDGRHMLVDGGMRRSFSTASRIFLSLKGGCSWLKRRMPWLPSGSTVVIVMSLLAAKAGRMSDGGCSYQSASPALSAAAAVATSGMYSHSTRSTLATLPPEAKLGGSRRGT